MKNHSNTLLIFLSDIQTTILKLSYYVKQRDRDVQLTKDITRKSRDHTSSIFLIIIDFTFRYSTTNVKMVSYNLTNIRERRMASKNNKRAYPERNESPDFFLENNSDVSSSLEGRWVYTLPPYLRP